jgi:hypothetical protein
MTTRSLPPDVGVVRLYRWLTIAYPPAFRLTFADSMAADLNDALRDAQGSGSKAVAILLVRVGADLVWSMGVQWTRTSVPWLTLAYATALVCFCEGLASALLGGPFKVALVVALLPFVSAITFTFWFVVPQVRRRRARPPCLRSVV